MVLLGIDVSNNNPNVDMAAARAQGVGFVVAKASQGWAGGPGGWLDWTFVDIATRARKAGILPGGYHWLLRGNGAAQAQQFVASLQRVGGPRGLLCAVDIERNDWDQSLNPDPATVDAFLAEWDRITGKQPILLYGASWYHDGYMQAGARWPNRPLWVAQYNTAAGPIQNIAGTVTPGWMYPFGGWTSYAVRQFTSSAVAGGVQVDGNVCFLTMTQLQALTVPGGVQPDGGFILDADAKARFDKIDATIQQLVTIIEGGLDAKHNPYGVVGFRDVVERLNAIEAKLK